MVEVIVKRTAFEHINDIDEIIILEDLPEIKGEFEVKRIKIEKKPVKKAITKLLKKVKYNPRYLEETYDIKKVKRNTYRNYGYL
ncbi:MAG: hypothetical protein ACXABO_13365 [Promethearchaeota archaeon]|jgi:hypothetical protein